MDEKDLELLNDLSVTRNISRTSENLYITQSAVTKRLQKIEGELGVPLFLRSKKGLLPAPVLQYILPEVRAAADIMERIRSSASSYTGDISGTLRLGVAVNYARYRLIPVLKEYMERYPKVQIHLYSNRSNNVYRDLMNGSISLAIIRGEYAWRYGDIVLSEDRHCLVSKEQYSAEQLRDMTFISRDSDASYISNLSTWMIDKKYKGEKNDLHINDVETIKRLVENGIGWSVLSDICLDDFCGYIEPIVLKNGKSFLRRTHILFRQEYLSLPQAKAFVDLARLHES